MRVVLDACVPEALADDFPQGWSIVSANAIVAEGTSDRALLTRVNGFCDVLVTVDRSLVAQQNTRFLSFGIVTVRARSSALGVLRPLLPQIVAACLAIGPGETATVPR